MNRSEAGKKGYEKTKHILDQIRQKKAGRSRNEYELNPKHCLFCGEKISYEKREGKFCNKSCSAKFNNRGVTRHIKGTKMCSCGNPKKVSNKYCAECADGHVYSKVTTLAHAKNDKIRKRILLEERSHQCEVCGFSEWNGKPIPIELDHIDGDADNNSAANLRLICPNCHAQTETYKGANAGKNSSRQQMRRKRYANGQTF